MSKEHLAHYLNDHMSGSITALEILEQLEKEAPELTAYIIELKTDIEADREELRVIMDRLGIIESRIRQVGRLDRREIRRIQTQRR